MNVLSLCSGVGGIELGLKLHAGTIRTICYVEGEAYAAACLVARMECGLLDRAPIWSDVRSFDGRPWRGKVDLVTAGFPCQPFSQAGRRLRENDPRHLWPEVARIIRECEPGFAFLENNNTRAFKEPYRDLRAMGFTLSDPFACTAAELGAGHIGRRVFVLAHNEHGTRFKPWWRSWACRENPPKHQQVTWWRAEPGVERVVHGVPNRVDRDRALGNAVVPAMAAFAFESLMSGLP